MDAQEQLDQEKIGWELYANGYSFHYCTNSYQEWGWTLAGAMDAGCLMRDEAP